MSSNNSLDFKQPAGVRRGNEKDKIVTKSVAVDLWIQASRLTLHVLSITSACKHLFCRWVTARGA